MKFMLNIILLCISFGLHGQTLELITKQYSRSDTMRIESQALDSILADKLQQLQLKGYLHAKIDLRADEQKSDRLFARILTGAIPPISMIHFGKVKQRDEDYLTQEFKMGATEISFADLPRGINRIRQLGYQVDNNPLISRDSDKQFHIQYNVLKSPELRVQGLASFNQSSGADTVAWFGQIYINVPNFDGHGKSLDFAWERLKSNSESFHIGFKYPWIYQLPLNANFQFRREVIEGYYQIVQSNVALDWSLDWERSLSFIYENNQSIITHEGALLNPDWDAVRKRLVGLGYRQVNLNSATHKGLSLKTTLFQEMNFEPESVRKFNYRGESELNVLPKIYLSQRSMALIQNQTEAGSDPSLLVPLGGVNTVRGYEESFMRVPNLMSMQNNVHLLLGNQSQVFAFYDIGLYYAANGIENLQGYGVGFQLRSGRGPLRLIIASHKGLHLRNSFFHLEYTGGIAWIDR